MRVRMDVGMHDHSTPRSYHTTGMVDAPGTVAPLPEARVSGALGRCKMRKLWSLHHNRRATAERAASVMISISNAQR
jgi:hypothetical protein